MMAETPKTPTLREIASEIAKTMPCNCDLDNWQPTRSTGHSPVCRIYEAAFAKVHNL